MRHPPDRRDDEDRDGTRTNLGRGLNVPTTVGVDGAGNVYVSEFEARSIRRIDAGTGRMTRIGR